MQWLGRAFGRVRHSTRHFATTAPHHRPAAGMATKEAGAAPRAEQDARARAGDGERPALGSATNHTTSQPSSPVPDDGPSGRESDPVGSLAVPVRLCTVRPTPVGWRVRPVAGDSGSRG